MNCYDCKGRYSAYHVHDHVWLKAWPTYREDSCAARQRKEALLLCFQCLEARLGRSLTLADFPDAIINTGIRFGYHLGRRTR